MPIGKPNPSWDLGVDMRIHIVQDFNGALLVRLKLRRGGCLFASFSHLRMDLLAN